MYSTIIFTFFLTIFMATKAQNARQPYGLTDELVDSPFERFDQSGRGVR
jgi:hypothetical protein